jgi:hypothetical protein
MFVLCYGLYHAGVVAVGKYYELCVDLGISERIFLLWVFFSETNLWKNMI